MRSNEHEARGSAGVKGCSEIEPAALDHDRMARADLLHLLHRQVEHGHERGTLRGEGDDLVVLEPVAGPDARRVARDKRVAVADKAAERRSPRPSSARPGKGPG